MRPCDCKDAQDLKMLNENGIQHNNDSLEVIPNIVILKLDNTTIKISMHRFKQFAEWYMTDQEKDETSRMEPLPDYGDLMTIKEFKEGCISNALTDDDGSGNYATEKEMSNIEVSCSDVAMGVVDKRFTHVVWFNK